MNLTGTSRSKGIEVSLRAEATDALGIKGSYTYTRAQEPNGLKEVRRPRHAGSISMNYAFADGRGNAHVEVTYNGRMDDLEFITATPQTRVTLDAYTLVNAGVSFQVTDWAKLYGRVENLFDQDYQEVFGFNTQGTTAFLGMRIALGGMSDPEAAR
ncbi:MAG: TonB-dependent receptor [Alphaproteobacteria bacterium]|nr:MAG: TonB-dependent receptor [Alphaproteobacteria bacterium]